MRTIGENTSVTLGVLIAVLGGLVLGALQVGGLSKQVEINTGEISALKEQQRVMVEIRTDIAVIKNQLGTIQSKVDQPSKK